ncbi:hypothetical protein KOW79_006577 [Hemibagrus wyckioides]|uniref:Uncharacterized protein n=1 Tax=Hemibagrus wyckioides TaxID=337641 RepID=A0A9D3NWY5_9TELE|nr:hypothetical protein KOW79_006577 [Hemibagrus wyckioides]
MVPLDGSRSVCLQSAAQGLCSDDALSLSSSFWGSANIWVVARGHRLHLISQDSLLSPLPSFEDRGKPTDEGNTDCPLHTTRHVNQGFLSSSDLLIIRTSKRDCLCDQPYEDSAGQWNVTDFSPLTFATSQQPARAEITPGSTTPSSLFSSLSLLFT